MRSLVKFVASFGACVSFTVAAHAQTTYTVYAFSAPSQSFSTNLPGEPVVSDITIWLGDSIEWEVVSGTHDTVADLGQAEYWESPLMEPGATFTHTFTNEGTFTYYCTPHQFMGMTGSVTVVPEPSTLAALALGGVLVVGRLRRRK